MAIQVAVQQGPKVPLPVVSGALDGEQAVKLPEFFEVLAISDSITPGGDLGLAPAVAERLVSTRPEVSCQLR